MKRASLSAIVFGSALSACATTSKVLETPVDEVVHSKDSVDEVVRCFEHNHLRAIERPDGSRVVSFKNGYGGVVRTFSMVPEGTGTRIDIRYYGIQVPGPWKRCVGLKPRK